VNAAGAGPALPSGLPWRRALGRAALVVWLPVLVPIVTGMLRDCGHCQSTYWMTSPMVPGVLVPVLLRSEDAGFVGVGVLATLAFHGVVAVLLRELPRAAGVVVQGIVALAVAGEAVAFAYALRA
jgi:hypothetical protein